MALQLDELDKRELLNHKFVCSCMKELYQIKFNTANQTNIIENIVSDDTPQLNKLINLRPNSEIVFSGFMPILHIKRN